MTTTGYSKEVFDGFQLLVGRSSSPPLRLIHSIGVLSLKVAGETRGDDNRILETPRKAIEEAISDVLLHTVSFIDSVGYSFLALCEMIEPSVKRFSLRELTFKSAAYATDAISGKYYLTENASYAASERVSKDLVHLLRSLEDICTEHLGTTFEQIILARTEDIETHRRIRIGT